MVSARTGLRIVFGVQIAIAAALLANDFAEVAPTLAFPSLAPDLAEPVRPGDQTRRFDPARMPARPATGMPAAADMPSRLFFDTLSSGVVRVTGQVQPGDAARFADWLDSRVERPARLLLDSPGGSVDDALAIGRRIREAGLETGMEGSAVCLSACPYILMGGVARRVEAGAQVGVHQHYYGENTMLPAFLAVEDIQRSQADVLSHLIEMGIDPMLMRHSLATPPDEIYLLLPEELERYRVATAVE
jgi:hypothetical protein